MLWANENTVSVKSGCLIAGSESGLEWRYIFKKIFILEYFYYTIIIMRITILIQRGDWHISRTMVLHMLWEWTEYLITNKQQLLKIIEM